MRATIIFEDRTIIVDGDAKTLPAESFPAFDPNWHACQWHGTAGTIEVKIGERLWIETDEALAPFVAAFDAYTPPAPEPAPPADPGLIEA